MTSKERTSREKKASLRALHRTGRLAARKRQRYVPCTSQWLPPIHPLACIDSFRVDHVSHAIGRRLPPYRCLHFHCSTRSPRVSFRFRSSLTASARVPGLADRARQRSDGRCTLQRMIQRKTNSPVPAAARRRDDTNSGNQQ